MNSELPEKFKNKTFKKSAMFTDIHFGKHANSTTHNQDCLDFIDWFIDMVKKDGEVDHIVFLGDWNENRSSLNISTLNYSFIGAKKLNNLNIPIFFIIGNHDLYQRNTRDVHSVISFSEFSNFILIDKVSYFNEVGNGTLFCPFLFQEEYKELQKLREVSTWYGHFEFKGFAITGYGTVMQTGPDASDFVGPSRIFSGHFHKRQLDKNVCYIGNVFPMDFGDSNDNDRGMAIYNYNKDELIFENWAECPKYTKVKLSSIINNPDVIFDKKTNVKCVIDIPIEYEESMELRKKFQDESTLREFTLEESSGVDDIIANTETTLDEKDLGTIDDIVVKMLKDIDSEQIDSEYLIKLYNEIRVV